MRLQHYPSTKEEPTLCASTRESLKFYGQEYNIKKAHVFLYLVLYIILIILFDIISFHLSFLVSKILRTILLSLHTTHCHCSVTKSCPTPYSPMDRSTPSYSALHSLPEFAQIHVLWVVMLSNHLILCHPLFLLLSVFPSIRVFSSEWAFCIRWPKSWSSSFSISPFNEYSGLISFRIAWFDLLTVQRTFKSPTPQSKRISSSVPILLYGTTLTSVHDYWEIHSFDCTDLCWQCDVSAF